MREQLARVLILAAAFSAPVLMALLIASALEAMLDEPALVPVVSLRSAVATSSWLATRL